MDMKRFFLYFITIAALALAGCGGNGGPRDMVDNGGPPDEGCPTGQEKNADGVCVTPAPPGPTDEEIAATTKAAGTKRVAIEAEAAQTDDAGLGGSETTATGNAEGAYNLAIERDRDSTTVTVTVEGATDDDDEKFVQAMDLGGGTTMHVRAMEADDDGNVVEEVTMVTTDIEAPKGVEFAKFEAMDGTTPQALDVRKDGMVASDTNPNDSLNVNTTARSALMSAMMFSSGSGGGTVNFDGDIANTADMDEADEVMGYYNGSPGTFRCNDAGGCTVTLADGKVTDSSNDWIFTPAAGATSDQPDYDYLSYGFWLKKTTDKDGVLTYNEVETFASSSLDPSGTVVDVTGTATYSGGATGVYVKNVTTSTGVIESATSGHFTATANLTATFGQVDAEGCTGGECGTIAPSMLNTLTGTISDYQLAQGEANNWMTVLDGDITANAGTAAGTAEGGRPGADYDGSFSATFHGDTGADDTTKPGSVVGEFNSFFTDGTVAGGFGARKDP